MREDTVIKGKDGHHYKIRFQSKGLIHPEDNGLWWADRVTWNWKLGYWMHHDDDVYILTDEGQVIAREIGWNLRREEINDTYD